MRGPGHRRVAGSHMTGDVMPGFMVLYAPVILFFWLMHREVVVLETIAENTVDHFNNEIREAKQ